LSVYEGPSGYELADWRRQINDLYASVRAIEDPVAGWWLWHETRTDLFREHPVSPIAESERESFGGIPVFNYDSSLRFEVKLDAVLGDALSVDLARDGTMTYRPIAQTLGLSHALGGELTVYWIAGYGGGLFIPFRDETNGSETYGGGRYIVDAIKGSDLGLGPSGGLILDFNFAYNPSCALSDTYVCPLAPPDNRPPAPVRGGERVL